MRSPNRIPLLCGLCLALACGGAAPDAPTKLYVLGRLGNDVTVIDVRNHEILRRIPVGRHPHGIAAPRSQDVLYVSNEADSSLSVIDPRTDTVVATHAIPGRGPQEIEVTPDGRFVYVPMFADGVYEVFDTREEKIAARIPIEGYPHNVVVSPDGRWMYLAPIDQPREKASPTPADGPRYVYVADAQTHTVVARIELVNAPRPLVVSPDGRRLYVNTDRLLGFVVLDTGTRTQIQEARYRLTEAESRGGPSWSHGITMAAGGAEVWSADTGHGAIHVFDVTGDAAVEVARVDVGGTPVWLTATPGGETVYSADARDGTVSAIDVATREVVARIEIGKDRSPRRMLVLQVPAGEARSGH